MSIQFAIDQSSPSELFLCNIKLENCVWFTASIAYRTYRSSKTEPVAMPVVQHAIKQIRAGHDIRFVSAHKIKGHPELYYEPKTNELTFEIESFSKYYQPNKYFSMTGVTIHVAPNDMIAAFESLL